MGDAERSHAEFAPPSTYRPPADVKAIPARDLTPEQARDDIVHRIILRELSVQGGVVFDSHGRITRPAVGSNVRVVPNILMGIPFVNVEGPGARIIDNVELRNLVGLLRLAELLRKRFNATTIYHMGIGHGRGRNPNDCHHQGRALDFAGADIAGGRRMVQRDWGDQAVPGADHRTPSVWPPHTRTFSYRLSNGAGPPRDATAHDLFLEVYRFATREYQDRAEQHESASLPRSTIGELSMICHPDHPAAGLRVWHQNHIHMQIGPTVAAPPHP